MFAALARVLTSRPAGPLGLLLSLVLAIALAAVHAQGRREAAQLKGQVSDLQRRLEVASLQAQATCRDAPRPAAIPAASDPAAAAERLAASPPEGFDVCARMESADQAVLATLR